MVNDRQFYLSREDSVKIDGWKKLKLKNGFYIHYHKDLMVSYASESIALLGYVWQVDPEKKTPAEELAKLELQHTIIKEDVFEVEKSWCGRYLLIVEDWIYLDACGLINIFYSNKTIASSLNVLCQVENREVIYPSIVHRKSPDFVPGMLTPYEGVRRLMPSQILNYVEQRWETRPLLVDPIPSFKTSDEGTPTLERYFTQSVLNLAKVFSNRRIWVASTSGRDSRTTIALMHKAHLDFSTFTLWHPHISKADRILPRRLAKVLKRNYKYVERKSSNYSEQKFKDYKIHCAGMAVDEDWRFYSYDQYPALREGNHDIVIIRSGIWGIANEYYTRKFGANGSNLSCIYPGIKSDEFLYRTTMDWDSYVKSDSINTNINYIDRIYWELREASWLASIEQSFDVMDGIVSIQIFNCRLLIGLLLGFPLEERLRKDEENRITEAACPALSKVPYDYQYENQFCQKAERRLKNLIGKILRRLKRLCV